MDDTARLIAFILLAAFAIERVVATAKYFLDGWEPTRDKRRKRLRQVLLFGLAGAVALAIVDFGNIRIVQYLQQHPPQLLDYWLTWLVVVAGADRARSFLQKEGGAAEAAESTPKVPPIKIVLDDGTTLKELSHAS